jgi:hypothetical protein
VQSGKDVKQSQTANEAMVDASEDIEIVNEDKVTQWMKQQVEMEVVHLHSPFSSFCN